MQKKEPQYIIRNSDEQTFTSPSMPCHEVIAAARSGNWGNDCLIDEVYFFGHHLPCTLRRIASYSSHRGFQMVETDKEFQRFLVVNSIEEPRSPALNESRVLFK